MLPACVRVRSTILLQPGIAHSLFSCQSICLERRLWDDKVHWLAKLLAFIAAIRLTLLVSASPSGKLKMSVFKMFRHMLCRDKSQCLPGRTLARTRIR